MSIFELMLYFFAFMLVGISIEVLMTSITNAVRYKNLVLRGKTTAWMFPIYGAVSFIIIAIYSLFPTQSIFFRAIFYTIAILAWEYLSGYVVRLLIGHSPWSYNGDYPDHSLNPKKHLHGLICLEFIPVWYVFSLLAELLYLFLKTHFVL